MWPRAGNSVAVRHLPPQEERSQRRVTTSPSFLGHWEPVPKGESDHAFKIACFNRAPQDI